MAVARSSLMSGVVGYGVMAVPGLANEHGEQVFEVVFIDRETGEEFHVRMSESGCKDLGAKLQGTSIIVAPAGSIPNGNGAGG